MIKSYSQSPKAYSYESCPRVIIQEKWKPIAQGIALGKTDTQLKNIVSDMEYDLLMNRHEIDSETLTLKLFLMEPDGSNALFKIRGDSTA